MDALKLNDIEQARYAIRRMAKPSKLLFIIPTTHFLISLYVCASLSVPQLDETYESAIVTQNIEQLNKTLIFIVTAGAWLIQLALVFGITRRDRMMLILTDPRVTFVLTPDSSTSKP